MLNNAFFAFGNRVGLSLVSDSELELSDALAHAMKIMAVVICGLLMDGMIILGLLLVSKKFYDKYEGLEKSFVDPTCTPSFLLPTAGAMLAPVIVLTWLMLQSDVLEVERANILQEACNYSLSFRALINAVQLERRWASLTISEPQSIVAWSTYGEAVATTDATKVRLHIMHPSLAFGEKNNVIAYQQRFCHFEFISSHHRLTWTSG